MLYHLAVLPRSPYRPKRPKYRNQPFARPILNAPRAGSMCPTASHRFSGYSPSTLALSSHWYLVVKNGSFIYTTTFEDVFDNTLCQGA